MISGQYVTIDGSIPEGYSIIQAEPGQIPLTIQTSPSEAQIQADSGRVESLTVTKYDGYSRNQ